MSELNFMHENISGIYNYCDRWCEKCLYTNRCLLFKQEAEREIKHLLKDENESDSEHYSKLLADELEDAEKLFSQNPDTEDFLDSLDDDEDFDFDEEGENDEDDFEEFLDENKTDSDDKKKEFNPLIHLTEEMFKEQDTYYNVIKAHFPDEVEKYNPEDPLIKNLQILSWYVPQITVKMRMCFWGKKQSEKAKSKLSKEIEEEMLNVSSRIVYLGINNILTALNELRTLRKEIETETVLFISTLKIIRQMFLDEFPKAETYKRPYFD